MNVMFNELRQNGINMDIEVLRSHINSILDEYKDLYESAALRPVNFTALFFEMETDNFGRIMAYLAYVYAARCSHRQLRTAVQLVASSLKRCLSEAPPTEPEMGGFQRLWTYVRALFKR